MRQIRFLLYKEFRQFFRDRLLLIVVIVMPVVMLIILGSAVTTDVKNIAVVVEDLDRSATSRKVVDKIKYSGYFNLFFSEKGSQRIGDYLDSGQAKIALMIPRHFEHDIINDAQPTMQLIINGEDAKGAQIAMGYLSQILKAFAQNLLFEQLTLQPQIAQQIHLIEPETRMWYNPNLESVNFMVPVIVVMIVTVFSMFFTAIGIVREKESGTLEQLLVTPLSSIQLILGKTIPYVIIAFVDASLVMMLARLLFDIPMVGSLWLLFGYLFIYILSTLGLGIFISTLAETQMQSLFLSWFFLVLMFILSGFFIPIENMPNWVQILSYLDPLRYMVTTVREIFLKGSAFRHLWQEAASMLGFGLILIGMSVVRFRKRVK